MKLIEIKNLHAETLQGQDILRGINLIINCGEVHAIMGPNGSGKSTLSKVLAGHPDYRVTQGEILFYPEGTAINLLELAPYERARIGVFLGMQYPVEIPGVSNLSFLRECFNEICKTHGAATMDAYDFNTFLEDKLKLLEFNPNFLERSLNEGFSGGEKKKNEILQLLTLNPRLALLDETDSGLDIDALKIVAKGVNHFKNKFNAVCLITHYQRLLDYVVPQFIHILYQGKIVKTGGKELALQLEKSGYESIPEITGRND